MTGLIPWLPFQIIGGLALCVSTFSICFSLSRPRPSAWLFVTMTVINFNGLVLSLHRPYGDLTFQNWQVQSGRAPHHLHSIWMSILASAFYKNL